MRYGSVCSGIEAATVAWHGLGWTPTWFSEIEPFPCAVLKHHYPAVPNHGDMSKFEVWRDEPIDLLVGGTPCQSFSVAGLRKGLDDPRGNLMLTFGAIAQRFRPEWLVWENVPGVLSSNGGRDFGTFLGMLAELGYGFAYRVLDAQYFGVAQRRRRVFVVANARSWQRAAAVLFERHSLQGHPAPSRETGQGIANGIEGSVELCGLLNARDYKDPGTDGMNHNSTKMVPVVQPVAFPWQSALDPIGQPSGVSGTLIKNQTMAVLQPVDVKQVQWASGGGQVENDTAQALRAGAEYNYQFARVAMQVRRLTPVECERLQGFPDNYTNISWRKKPESPDGPRYKALGNSMAVPVMRWIGERIQVATARQEVKP